MFWCRDFLTGKEKLCREKLKIDRIPKSQYVNLNPGLHLNFANHLHPEVREFPEFTEFSEAFKFPQFLQFSGFPYFQISELKSFFIFIK